MNLSDITVMVLTRNEEANIAATLALLDWASDILIIDSHSTDRTIEIANQFPNVRILQRQFDHQTNQCNYGLRNIDRPWVLSIDADYKCDKDFAHSLEELDGSNNGYEAEFKYGVYGRVLRGSLYPKRTVLYRRECAGYYQDGHTQRVRVEGSLGHIGSPILHDDWKPLSRWATSQIRYAELEARKMLQADPDQLGWKYRIRGYYVVAPLLSPIYCLLGKRLILDGWHGIFYSMQRGFAELLLAMNLLDARLRNRSDERSSSNKFPRSNSQQRPQS